MATNVDQITTRPSIEVFPTEVITTVDDYNLDELKIEYTKSLRGNVNPTWECWLRFYIENKNFDQEAFDKDSDELRALIKQDFGSDCLNEPNCLYENVEDYKNRIDDPLTTLKSILVKDNRVNCKYSHYWRNTSPKEKAQFTNYTPVHSTDDQPITMKHIINTLQKDPHYHKEDVWQQHHNFIEGYKWTSPCVFEFEHGS